MNKILKFKKIIFVGFFAAFMAVFLSAAPAQASFWDWLNLNKTNSNSQQSAATANADTTSASSSSSTSATITAKTGQADNITSNSARLKGSINPQGENISVYFKYRKSSESSEMTKTTDWMSAGSRSIDFAADIKISNLSSGAEYIYRFYAYNYTSGKTVYGDVKSFTTLSGSSNSSSSKNSSSSVSSKAGSSSSSSSVQQYTLKVKISGHGRVSGSSGESSVISCVKSADRSYSESNICTAKINKGNSVTLTVSTPDTQYEFATWAEACRNSQGATSCMVTMNGDKTVSATFNTKGKSGEKTAAVSVRKTGAGVGKVVSIYYTGKNSGKEDGRINCGNNCSENYEQICEGTTEGRGCSLAYFKAIAEKGSTFSFWGGDCLTFKGTKDQCYVTLDDNKNITANFNEGSDNADGKYYDLTIAASSGGVVTSTDGKINCGANSSDGSDCSHSYGKNGTVTLKATPNSGYTVGDYSGCSKSGNVQNGVLSCKVKMTQKRNVTINFKSSGVSSSSSSNSKSSSSSSSYSFATNLKVITNSATIVTSNSATLNGIVNPKDENVSYRFYYVKKGQPETQKTTSWTSVASGSSDVSVTAEISGLSSGTTYNFAISAYSYTSKKFTKIGGTQSFTTSGGSSSSSSSSNSSSSSSQTTSSTYKLEVTISGNGRIQDTQSKIDCGSNMTCQATYSKGQVIRLLTDEANGSGDSFNTKVDSWSGGGCSGTSNSCEITMDGDKKITVKFVSK